MNKKFVLISLLSTLAVGASSMLFHKNVSNVDASDDTRIIYLDCTGIAFFTGDIRASFFYVEDDDTKGYASDLEMKKAPEDGKIYRITLPNDFPYNEAYFCAYESGTSVLWAETNIVNMPSNKNTYVLDKDKEIPGNPYLESGDWVSRDYDVPTEGDGYYLVNSRNDFKFKDAPKFLDGSHDDKLEYLNYEVNQSEEITYRSYFNDEEQLFDERYVIEESGAINVFVDEEDHLIIDKYVVPPSEEGFYISGTFSGVDKWAYADSLKMSNIDGEYLAVYLGLECNVDDQIRVRSYSYESHPWDKWANVGADQDVSTFGHINGDNFEFTVGGTYDVYVKMEDTTLAFYIFDNGGACSVELTCLYYDGVTKVDSKDIAAQLAYPGVEYSPNYPFDSYKYYVGAYYDEECTQKYDPVVINENTHLYLKYINNGYYMVNGKMTLDSVINSGVKMNTSDLTSEYIADIVTYVEANSRKEFGFFTGSGQPLPAAAIAIGHEAVREDYYYYTFLVSGTYRIIINDNNHTIFIDYDGESFIRSHGNEIEIDKDNKVVTPLATLKEKFIAQKEIFLKVEDPTKFNEIGFKYIDNPTNLFEEFLNKYYLAIYRYGSDELENYIFPNHERVEPHPYPDPVPPEPEPEPEPSDPSGPVTPDNPEQPKDYTLIITLSILGGAVLIGSLSSIFIFVKRRK